MTSVTVHRPTITMRWENVVIKILQGSVASQTV